MIKSLKPLINILPVIIVSPLFSQVYITEIMYDPLENDNANEFVEIWNGGEVQVDLNGYLISDGTGEDAIVSAGNGTLLGSRQFGIILDADYFTNSVLYADLIPEDCLVLTIESSTIGDRGLKNSEPEPVSIYDAEGNLISEYSYTIGNEPGHSDEKIILDGPNDLSNWSSGLSLHGTPGFINTTSPDSLNLSVSSFHAGEYILPSGNPVGLTASVMNTGFNEFSAIEIGFYKDDGDSLLTQEEMFDFLQSEGLNPLEEQTFITETGILWSGNHLFAVQILNADEDSTDNISFLTISVTADPQSVIINEVMYKPLTGEPEWVELFNPFSQTVILEGWFFSDSNIDDWQAIPLLEISPGSYAILAENSLPTGLEVPLDIPAGIIEGWNNLNNDGDALYLFDQTGSVIDSLFYPDNWGGINNGRSMERVSPASSIWFPSVDASGCTPGRENSVTMPQSAPSSASLKVSPELFTPGGGGAADETVISVKMPVPYSRISLRIFDLRGRLVRFLVESQTIGPEFSVNWDGTWDDGKTGRIGAYILHLQAVSEPYKVKYEAKTVVYLGGKL